MIKEVSSVSKGNYLLNSNSKTSGLSFNSNLNNEKRDRFEKSNKYLGFSKASIWAGLATATLTLGLMFFSNKKFSNKLWKIEDLNFTYFPLPVITGAAATLITDFLGIGNQAVSKNKK